MALCMEAFTATLPIVCNGFMYAGSIYRHFTNSVPGRWGSSAMRGSPPRRRKTLISNLISITGEADSSALVWPTTWGPRCHCPSLPGYGRQTPGVKCGAVSAHTALHLKTLLRRHECRAKLFDVLSRPNFTESPTAMGEGQNGRWKMSLEAAVSILHVGGSGQVVVWCWLGDNSTTRQHPERPGSPL